MAANSGNMVEGREYVICGKDRKDNALGGELCNISSSEDNVVLDGVPLVST